MRLRRRLVEPEQLAGSPTQGKRLIAPRRREPPRVLDTLLPSVRLDMIGAPALKGGRGHGRSPYPFFRLLRFFRSSGVARRRQKVENRKMGNYRLPHVLRGSSP